jgi:tRNA dimethylallyltransferase
VSFPVLFLVGPTAAGKSEIALRLAKRLGAEIISADSMQVYRGMDIGTAKPSRAARRAVRHHLIDVAGPRREFSVYDFRRRALKVLGALRSRGRLAIVAGGSGLYVRALLEGLPEQPGGDKKMRAALEACAREAGPGALYADLEQLDPAAARRIGRHNARRLIRALEICRLSKKTLSEWHARREPLEALGYEPLVIGLTRERPDLYARINARVDRMFRRGLAREVRKLHAAGLSKTAAQAVGYKELAGVLSSEDRPARAGLKAARERIKINSRRFAKRQMTWFRRERGIRWIVWPPGAPAAAVTRELLAVLPPAFSR